METYKPTIGIEVHAELKTRTKMFCNSKNDPHESKPNSHVCPVCLAHPGTLPVINREAVRHVLMVGTALQSELATYTEFDRKNYFYPDIPKGYQISQYLFPLVKGGELAGVKITRVHLEEDTARSLHDQREGSIVDYNRAGVPLMELVTEPVIHDSQTAVHFARELQLLLRTLGVSDANMERGEMRVEANISISKSETFGTKVEVKNLNSFKSVESAIEYEIKRQTSLLDKGARVVQETRGWDENKDQTFSQRVKESADDYRYFPDPDLPKLDLSKIPELSLSRIADVMPDTPENKRNNLLNLGLPRKQVEILISDIDLCTFFEATLSSVDIEADTQVIKLIANYLTTDVVSLLNLDNDISKANSEYFVSLITMAANGVITSRVAKDLLEEVVFMHKEPLQLAKDRNLLIADTADELKTLVSEIVAQNAEVVSEYKNGKEAALQFLVGQGMKATKGSADPVLLAELLRKEIT